MLYPAELSSNSIHPGLSLSALFPIWGANVSELTHLLSVWQHPSAVQKFICELFLVLTHIRRYSGNAVFILWVHALSQQMACVHLLFKSHSSRCWACYHWTGKKKKNPCPHKSLYSSGFIIWTWTQSPNPYFTPKSEMCSFSKRINSN